MTNRVVYDKTYSETQWICEVVEALTPDGYFDGWAYRVDEPRDLRCEANDPTDEGARIDTVVEEIDAVFAVVVEVCEFEFASTYQEVIADLDAAHRSEEDAVGGENRDEG